MPQLLLELFSEEIPARMQKKAEADLGKALGAALGDAGLSFDALSTCSGPRRLTAVVDGLPEKSEDVREERKGPKVGAPEKAVEGFMRGAGLATIEQAEVRSDPKKGDFYVAVMERPGKATADIVAEIVPELVRGFHWPKSMRWGTGDLRWVRPLQRILCVLGGDVVPFEIDGLASGNETEGHRVHGRGPFSVTGWEDYRDQLEQSGRVRLKREDRKGLIAERAAAVCAAAGLELVDDEGLLEEVTGLAEWPVPVLGEMDPAFLDLPPEVVKLSMRTHQKYFAVRDPKTGDLAPSFVTVANIEATDGGAKIAEGNAKVLSARLEDARFFYENDKNTGLDAMVPKLASIDFKKELGSIADKVERVAALARELAPKVGADPDLAEKAARLAKADLVSEMVYEFPELQGVMGRYYALERIANPVIPGEPKARPGTQSAAAVHENSGSRIEAAASSGMTSLLDGLSQNEITQIADAIRDHYQPQGPSNPVPTEPVSIAVALADKLDTLVGFWAIDEKPTGSKDPFALRRAALGVVRIVLENETRRSLAPTLASAYWGVVDQADFHRNAESLNQAFELERSSGAAGLVGRVSDAIIEKADDKLFGSDSSKSAWLAVKDLLSFFADRLKQHLRDEGQRHDLIDAVFALGEDDLVLITKRVEALGTFLDTEDGANLLAGYKRAANILKAEEKKTGDTYAGDVDTSLLTEQPEQDLHTALTKAVSDAETAIEQEDFETAMAALAPLRQPVDTFFDNVTVNAEDPALRRNRLLILTMMRDALGKVADFSKVEG
ncbi:MAG: glycine--tRNA ligase subunit beta [Pseudomonadota bacterium]